MMKVGIIGFGTAAREGHIPSFRELGLDIIGVADVSKRALKYAQDEGINTFTDYTKLLKEDLDFVSICSPGYLHSKMCIAVAESGANILVEKPLALKIDEALDIKKKIEREGVKICVVHNYKFLEPIRKAKRMQLDEELGRLLSIHTISHHSHLPAHNSWKQDETKAGSMLFEWIHPIYIQQWFGGKPKSVFAVGNRIAENYPFIRDIKALIKFNDCSGYLEMSQFCSTPLFALNISGTGASVNAKLPVKFRIRAPATSIEVFEEVFSSLGDVIKLGRMFLGMRNPCMKYTWGSHFMLINEFVQAIEKDVSSPIPIDEGIEAIRLVKAIEDSIHLGREIHL